MHSVAASLWNQVAASQPLQHPVWERRFLASPEEQEAEMDRLEETLRKAGFSPVVIRAFLLTAPLLAENVAISRFVQQSNNPSLRISLPEIVSPTEAIRLAAEEFRMTKPEQSQLRTALETKLTA